MNQYKFVLQMLAILFLLLVFFFFFRFVRMLNRKKRMEPFSCNKEKQNTFSFYPIIAIISVFLEKLGFLHTLALYYNKFIYDGSYLKKGMDYISIKILGGVSLTIIYLFCSALFGFSITLDICFFLFLLGMLLVHFYVFFSFKRNTEIMFSSIVNAIFILNGSLKMGKSIEGALKDTIKRSEGILKKEFQKVLSDMALGLTLGDAFYRFYERTKILFLKDVSAIFKLLDRGDISKMKVFDTILNLTIEENKKRENYKSIRNHNYIAALVLSFLPFIVFVIFLLSRVDSFSFLLSNYAWILFSGEGFFYLFYLLLMKSLVRRRYL